DRRSADPYHLRRRGRLSGKIDRGDPGRGAGLAAGGAADGARAPALPPGPAALLLAHALRDPPPARSRLLLRLSVAGHPGSSSHRLERPPPRRPVPAAGRA